MNWCHEPFCSSRIAINADLLRKNLQINDIAGRAELRQAAAGRGSGQATLIPGPSDNKGQSRIAAGAQGYQIEVVAVDEIVTARGKTLAVKIDVEGFECEALTGMTRLLNENRGIVQIETYDHEPEVMATMKTAGYALVTDMRPDFVFIK